MNTLLVARSSCQGISMKTGSLLWKVQPSTWYACTEKCPGYQDNALNMKWHQTLTVLSSKYIVLDKKSIPIVAYMVRAETQKCAVWVLPFCPPRTQFWKRSQSQLWASEQTDRQTPQMYTHCVIQSRAQTPFKKLIFFFKLGLGTRLCMIHFMPQGSTCVIALFINNHKMGRT